MARRITRSIGLEFASVDLLPAEDGSDCVVEVNGIPGWKGAQSVVPDSIARLVIECLRDRSAGVPPVQPAGAGRR
jgi:ribosomal protein S6--L-glutamate ligase